MPSDIRSRMIRSQTSMVGHEKDTALEHLKKNLNWNLSRAYRTIRICWSPVGKLIQKRHKSHNVQYFSVYFYNVSPEQC